jgi:hypothetical protein
MAWPQDAARRNAADFVSASVFSGERITIRAGRAALNPPLIIAGILGRIPPRPVVNHWAFDAEELPVEIGNDEEERWRLFGHGAHCVRQKSGVARTLSDIETAQTPARFGPFSWRVRSPGSRAR